MYIYVEYPTHFYKKMSNESLKYIFEVDNVDQNVGKLVWHNSDLFKIGQKVHIRCTTNVIIKRIKNIDTFLVTNFEDFL